MPRTGARQIRDPVGGIQLLRTGVIGVASVVTVLLIMLNLSCVGKTGKAALPHTLKRPIVYGESRDGSAQERAAQPPHAPPPPPPIPAPPIPPPPPQASASDQAPVPATSDATKPIETSLSPETPAQDPTKIVTLRDGWRQEFPVAMSDIVVGVITMGRNKGRVKNAKDKWYKGLRYEAVSESDLKLPGVKTHIVPQHTGRKGAGDKSGDWSGVNPGCGKHAPFPMLLNDTNANSYKWLLIGDDDSYFVLSNYLPFLGQFDYRKPYIFAHNHPHRKCKGKGDGTDNNCCDLSEVRHPCIMKSPVAGRAWCPVVKQPGQYFARMDTVKGTTRFRKVGWHLDGGPGYAISLGLMNAVPREFWDHCAHELVCDGGDVRLSNCIVNAGFGVTQIPPKYVACRGKGSAHPRTEGTSTLSEKTIVLHKFNLDQVWALEKKQKHFIKRT